MVIHFWLHDFVAAIRKTGPFQSLRRRTRTLSRTSVQIEVLDARTLLTTIDLASLGAGGTTIYGADTGDMSGSSVSNAGDINGDGYDDLLIGADRAAGQANTQLDAGESYVVFGGPNMPATVDLSNLGSAGITIYGADAGDKSGISVSRAADVNGDGYDDLIVGAYHATSVGNGAYAAGESYIIFGGSAVPATINLANLGSAGITLYGADEGDVSGVSVSSAGDVNGDGFDDVFIGAYRADAVGNSKLEAGESYVVFGGASLPATINLKNLGSSGITLSGGDLHDRSGKSVSSAGDINGDGFADLLIGADAADAAGNLKESAGETYVIFGGKTLPAAIDLGNMGSAGLTIYGADKWDYSGFSVSDAGDVNGDGFGDLIIGAMFADAAGNAKAYAGESYIVFGGPALPSTINLGNLGTSGVTIFGADFFDNAGVSVSGAGDVNGDGFDDVVIGAPHANGPANGRTYSGESYLIYGSPALPGTIDLANLGSNGVTLYGANLGDRNGVSVSGAGDVNGDGFADLILGSPYADAPGSNAFFNPTPNIGASIIVFGGNFTNSATQVGTAAADTLTGTAAVDKIVGGGGNDTLIGNGGADVLYGGQGDDVLAVSDTSFQRVDGGNGYDTLRLDGSGITLDLTAIADDRLTSIEAIDLRGSGSNSVILNQQEVLNLTQNSNPGHTANTLTILRNNDDTVNMGPGWTAGPDVVISGVTFHVFTQGAAILQVQADTVTTTTIKSTVTNPTHLSPIPVTVTFSDSVTGFMDTDVVVGNGTISGFSGSGITYTFNVTPTAAGLVTVDVAANVALDTSNHGNLAATQFSVTYVNSAPVDGNEIVSSPEDQTATGNVLDNATDSDLDPLSVINFTIAGDLTTYSAGQVATITSIGTLVINAAGDYTFSPVLNYNGSVPVVTYIVSDSVFTDTSTLTITVTPVNDPAAISGTTTGTVTEAGGVFNTVTGTPTASGTLTDTDVDNPANTFVAASAGTASDQPFGTYEMSAAGDWTYTLDNTNAAVQALNVSDTLTDTFTVQTVDGTAQVVTITIHGTNDAAVISGTTTGSVTEAGGVFNTVTGTPTASGTLTDTDVDNLANTFVAVSAGTASDQPYGTYEMSTAGDWTYTLDNTNAAVQALNVSDTLTDTFTVHTVDGTTQVVTITIHGTNDAAVISGTSSASLTETNVAQNTGGTLSATDVDNSNAFTQQTNVAGSNAYGTFNITSAGVWTYSMNNAHDEFVGGTDYTDSFTVATADGTSQIITVTIHGTNDAPTAHNDTFTTAQNASIILTQTDLTTNDLDVDFGDTLSVISVDSQGTLGAVDLLPGGSVSYDPSGQFDGLLPGQSATDTFTYTIADSSGATSTATVTITVYRITPPIAEANGPYSVNEGSQISLSSAGSEDLDGSIVSYEWDYDYDGSNFDVDATGASPTYSGIDGPTTKTIALRVRDNDGATSIDTTTLTVNNVAPTLSNVTLSSPINENDYATLSGNITDPGVADTFTLTVNWGDGSSPEVFSYLAGTTSFNEQHQYLDDNPTGTSSDTYSVSVALVDDDGGAATASTSISLVPKVLRHSY
jgi:VCBS repeat-containing protein